MMANDRLFDSYAATYQRTVNDSITASGEDVDFFALLKAQLVARHLAASRDQRPARLLDFGCGTGLSTRMLASTLPGASRLVGVDVSGESIDRARAATSDPRVEYCHVPGDALPFADASVGVAFAACVFHHIDRAQHAWWADEIRRVLVPGGWFFLFEHNPLNPLTVRAVRACPFDEGVELLRPRYARRLLADVGLATEPARFYFFFPGPLRALRPLERGLGWLPVGAQYYVAGRRPT